MNDIETIRAAARLMRERAETACPGPWFITAMSGRYGGVVAKPTADFPEDRGYDGHLIGESLSAAHREYVASWDPTVTLLVAEWLEDVANGDGVDRHALGIARAYLAAIEQGAGVAA
ncbi:hypothetical protein [Micromonospora sp. NPDC050695]|uniref:hypothetical protein n=1 Tax=Micromonospora sp. NPDC050695 TaxID=3154938 RepID=UPI0033DBF502